MTSLFCYYFNKCKRMTRKVHVFAGECALREKFTRARRAVPEPSSPGRLWDPWFTAQLDSACINPAWKHSPSWAYLKQNQTCLNQPFKKFRHFTERRMPSFLSLLSSLHFLSPRFLPPFTRNKGMLLFLYTVDQFHSRGGHARSPNPRGILKINFPNKDFSLK